ncbi:MAG: endonuclease III [Candidatus Omnitrophica bacterium]|nr:endonuclease III [Candidatus Omnitrophota bacterium]
MAEVLKVILILKRETKRFNIPWVSTEVVTVDPYKILISCILSLRTKDAVTRRSSERLFAIADTPDKVAEMSPSRLEKLIYPAGFYRNKARQIIALSKRLVDDFGGNVPHSQEALLSFKGVGRKTANLVLGLGFNIPAICVDTHVHRIPNRLGWIRTKKPVETEFALMAIIPKRYWIELNTLLVTLGQNICLPVSPFCGKCPVNRYCRKVGVTRCR